MAAVGNRSLEQPSAQAQQKSTRLARTKTSLSQRFREHMIREWQGFPLFNSQNSGELDTIF
jgi:hypothetical protein